MMLFCMQKGGGMANKLVVDAQAAQRALRRKLDAPSTNSSIQAKFFVAITGLNGKLCQLPAPPKTVAFVGMTTNQEFTPVPNHSTKY
ncbi:hypothetical protein C0995_011944 [Termitomyces sp. Mi166|nr:hypothetical protein C0995_011944 [Termitomyces sp. Mi166\